MPTVRAPDVKQLHVDLGGLTLPELVEIVVEQALLPLPEADRRRYLPQARQNVERVLRRHIVAYDMCGMSTVCQSSEPFDPWPAEPA